MAEGGRGNGNPVTAMQEKLKELSAAHDLVIKNNALLVKQIIEIEGGAVSGASLAKLKEKLALFKLTSDAMAKVSTCTMYTRTVMHIIFCGCGTSISHSINPDVTPWFVA